ncbi:MAG: threonine ammonia-lyase, biosynthetic [Sedimentisphaerales bacterium]|nr:threonine ammonia-lyase, biosynthetic [Sedimentisphaerales bacterium]
MSEKYIKKILEASVYDVAIETPVDHMPLLSERINNRVLIKREDLQPVFSFKLRGAYNKISKLTTREKKRGVIAASAGNHAQGVAISAQKLKIKATIVMPRTTPEIKVEAVKRRGSEVILYGERFDESCKYALQLAEKTGQVFIHPYDDPDVIAGQGTIGMEIMRQVTEPIHAIFIPVGGGGLIAGIAAYVKYLRPEIKIIGVEAEDSACLKAALTAGKRETLDKVGIFADGVAVAQVGQEPYRIARELVDEVVTATTDEICAAIKEVFDNTRSISEPSGALSVAGMINYVHKKHIRNKTLLTISSGANINFGRLRSIAESFEIGEKTEIVMAAITEDRPGILKSFCKTLSRHQISEFNYRFESDVKATIFAKVQIKDQSEDRAAIIKNLRDAGFLITDLTDNELAKMHICHMVGGRAGGVANEVLYRLVFPDCEGSLANFLTLLEPDWNVSILHYRRTGGTYAQVLIGIQIPEQFHATFEARMLDGKYSFVREQDNPAYKIFLS